MAYQIIKQMAYQIYNKTLDKTLAAIEFRSVIQFDEGAQFPLSDKHAHWCV